MRSAQGLPREGEASNARGVQEHNARPSAEESAHGKREGEASDERDVKEHNARPSAEETVQNINGFWPRAFAQGQSFTNSEA